MHDGTIKLTFVGDLMCSLEQTRALKRMRLPYAEIFKEVETLFSESDYVIGNLETPIAGEDLRFTHDAAVFNTPDGFAHAVRKVGIDFVSTANNHCLDRGVIGLDRTLKTLDAIGIEHTGTYSNEDESCRVFVKDFAGFKISFLSSTYGTNSESGTALLPNQCDWRVDLTKAQRKLTRSIKQRVLHLIGTCVPAKLKAVIVTIVAAMAGKTLQPPDYIADNATPELSVDDLRYHNRFIDKIRRAREKSDFVVVLPHVGGQYNPGPGEYQKKLVRDCFAAGADLVVAGHSHTPLRTEFVDGKLIAYSLGNFTFTPGVGWYIGNVLADYGVVLNVCINVAKRCLDSVSFSLVKSVVGNDGVSRVIPVDQILAQSDDPLVKERLIIENEVVVNRVRGDATTVLPAAFYELKMR